MTVCDLINELVLVENKDKPVVVCGESDQLNQNLDTWTVTELQKCVVIKIGH